MKYQLLFILGYSAMQSSLLQASFVEIMPQQMASNTSLYRFNPNGTVEEATLTSKGVFTNFSPIPPNATFIIKNSNSSTEYRLDNTGRIVQEIIINKTDPADQTDLQLLQVLGLQRAPQVHKVDECLYKLYPNGQVKKACLINDKNSNNDGKFVLIQNETFSIGSRRYTTNNKGYIVSMDIEINAISYYRFYLNKKHAFTKVRMCTFDTHGKVTAFEILKNVKITLDLDNRTFIYRTDDNGKISKRTITEK